MSSSDKPPFDEDAFKRQLERNAERRAKDGRGPKKGGVIERDGIRLTKYGAFKIKEGSQPGANDSERPQVFKITRSSPQATVQRLEVTNKDGSMTATLPMAREWYELFGDKLEIYVIGIIMPGGLNIQCGFVSTNPDDPFAEN